MNKKTDNPICCGKEVELIGITDRGSYKYYCTICHKIIVAED